jgi:thioredoxin-dependent peroxiredoxin
LAILWPPLKEKTMNERPGAITIGGSPFTLVGHEVNIGEKAPDATMIAQDMTPAKVSDFLGKVLFLSTVHSLDTSVCSIETRTFHEQLQSMYDDVVFATVSVDLPFAQARWCTDAGINNAVTLSDHKDTAVGDAFGVLIKELRLLARAVFVIDRNGVVQYKQIVQEVSDEPDYDSALAAVKKLI